MFCFHGVDMRLVVERDKLREQERKRWVRWVSYCEQSFGSQDLKRSKVAMSVPFSQSDVSLCRLLNIFRGPYLTPSAALRVSSAKPASC